MFACCWEIFFLLWFFFVHFFFFFFFFFFFAFFFFVVVVGCLFFGCFFIMRMWGGEGFSEVISHARVGISKVMEHFLDLFLYLVLV